MASCGEVLRQWGKDGFKELENLKRSPGDLWGIKMVKTVKTVKVSLEPGKDFQATSDSWFLCRKAGNGIAKLSAGNSSYLLHVKLQQVVNPVLQWFSGIIMDRDLFPNLLMVSEALPFGGHLLSCVRLELHGTSASVLRANLPQVQARSCNNSCIFMLIYVVHSSNYIFILSHGKLQVRGPKRMCGRLEATSLCHPGADWRGGRLGLSIGCHNVPHGRVPFSTYSLGQPFRLQTMLSIALGFPEESRGAKSSKRQNVTWDTETRRKQVHGQLQEMCLNPPGPMEDLWNAVDPSPRNIFPLELLSTSPQPKKKSATIRYMFCFPKRWYRKMVVSPRAEFRSRSVAWSQGQLFQ